MAMIRPLAGKCKMFAARHGCRREALNRKD
jgi:hypothetical protein